MKIRTARHQVQSNPNLIKLIFYVFIYFRFAEVFFALKNIEFPHIYPDPESRKLRRMLVNLQNSNWIS
jgi:hypothetical protein